MNKLKYQVVIEFLCDTLDGYDSLVGLENILIKRMMLGVVDGHDTGGGYFNIFVHSDEPKNAFTEVLNILCHTALKPNAAAYRPIDGDKYIRLLPVGDDSAFKLR